MKHKMPYRAFKALVFNRYDIYQKKKPQGYSPRGYKNFYLDFLRLGVEA